MTVGMWAWEVRGHERQHEQGTVAAHHFVDRVGTLLRTTPGVRALHDFLATSGPGNRQDPSPPAAR